VTEVVRLTLVSHAMTHAMATGRFPTDEPLNAAGRRQVEATADLWRGEALGGVRPEELEVWLDPTQAPHGGESIVDLIDRVARWLESLTDNRSRTVAVTHPAVIRAAILLALDGPPKSFWGIDIAPVSRTVMHLHGHSWTLRAN